MKQQATNNKQQAVLILLMVAIFFFEKSFSQEMNLSPEGKLETVYDNRGNQLKLKDILIDAPKEFGYLKTTTVTCSTTSYFNLYFEPGCGMEDTTNPTHNARRAVLCKVFEDISNFITSPLSTTGNKVNIWVRNIANESVPTGTLGLASSFYIPYSNGTNTIGGILDGEIWKTIHLGVDSYTNISSGTNTFYHGKVSFNFNDPSINWNTNLAINSPSHLYDLYTVILHEVVHSLGFGSFMNQNGASIDPSPYYSRYDTFLRTNNNIPLLTIGSCSMYDVSFNSAVSPTVLRPGCTLPNNISNGVLNNTVCNNALKYVGSSTVPVYTPACFEQGSSFSHFEDMLYPTCVLPYVNDSYFVLSNVNLLGTTKRYLKPEERNVLCDIGYNVNTTYGVSTTSNGFYNYGGTACTGITVAGLNDGINSSTGAYTFIGSIATTGATSTLVSISGLLANDINATGFECLQDITVPTAILNTSGNNTTISTFTTTTAGLHLLRYVPINGTKRGNITYVYVYIIPPANPGMCSPTPSTCDLIMNGNFEQYSSLPVLIREVHKACGWDAPTQISSIFPSYYNSNVTGTGTGSVTQTDIPCNYDGFQQCKNNIGNGYASIYRQSNAGNTILLTQLKTPLQANTNYQLSFDISLGDNQSNFVNTIQAYLSNTRIPINSQYGITITNTAMLFTSLNVIRNVNGWDTVSFSFTTTTGGEQFLYLGFLNNFATITSNIPSVNTSCQFHNTTVGWDSFSPISYYIDNVSLVPTNGAVFNLPVSICNTQILNDLSIYLNGTTGNGVFSGTGVTLASGVYSFNASVAGIGTTTIGYTFTNSSGCTTTLYDTITVSNSSSNSIVVDAVNDDFSSISIDSTTGGVTTSVYSNDLYNGILSTSASLPNVTFSLVAPISISGATINNLGLISIPAGTPVGTYTLTYQLSAIGNCTMSDMATVTIVVANSNQTPNIVPGIRANDIVDLIDLQSDNKIIISGAFTKYNNITKNSIARLNSDLTLDQTFLCNGNSLSYRAKDIAVQSDNKIIVVGTFSSYGGASNGNDIVRLNADGSNDSSFNVGGVGTTGLVGNTNNDVYSCAIQPDGKILIGGDFYYYNGVKRLGIVRLMPNGSIDTTFDPVQLNTYYRSIISNILIQPDGNILLEGIFSASGIPQNVKLIRITPTGQIDTGFAMGNDTASAATGNATIGNYKFYKMALQSTGKIIIVGSFSKYNGTTVKNIVRLLQNGQIDSSFNMATGVDRSISEISIEPTTNKIIIGGEITYFGSTAIKKMIRLDSNGNLDTTFSIGSGTTDAYPVSGCPYCSNRIAVLKQQPDGKIIVGGRFTTFNGLSATNITRIFGSAGVQAKSNSIEYQSEPEIDTNPNYSSITIYPNPSDGIYYFNLTDENEDTQLNIFNLLGEQVYKGLLIGNQENQIDLSHLTSGCYLVKLSKSTSTTNQKLIKN